MPRPDRAPLHLIVPYASAYVPGCQATVERLALPTLSRLLAVMAPGERNEGDAYSLSPPHERALAQAMGWAGADGCLPWAAHLAAQDGHDPADLAWGLLTPVHWRVGADQISMADPTALDLTADESRAMFDAIHPLFETEGWLLVWGAPLRWYVAHETLAELPTASLDRVVGRSVDAWMPDHPRARLIRRLQNEVQMLLYQHPVNEAREARGLWPVNSFWLSGCGHRQLVQQTPGVGEPQVEDRLRTPAWHEDWDAWSQAWQALDREALAPVLEQVRAGRPARLTLCGDRHAQNWSTAADGSLARWLSRWRRVQPARLLADL